MYENNAGDGKEKKSKREAALRAYLHNGAEWYSLSDNISSCTIRPYSRDKASPMPQTPPFNSKHPSHVDSLRSHIARRLGLFIARYLSARRLVFLRRSCSPSFEYPTDRSRGDSLKISASSFITSYSIIRTLIHNFRAHWKATDVIRLQWRRDQNWHHLVKQKRYGGRSKTKSDAVVITYACKLIRRE